MLKKIQYFWYYSKSNIEHQMNQFPAFFPPINSENFFPPPVCCSFYVMAYFSYYFQERVLKITSKACPKHFLCLLCSATLNSQNTVHWSLQSPSLFPVYKDAANYTVSLAFQLPQRSYMNAAAKSIKKLEIQNKGIRHPRSN